jgi:hypothetical protein
MQQTANFGFGISVTYSDPVIKKDFLDTFLNLNAGTSGQDKCSTLADAMSALSSFSSFVSAVASNGVLTFDGINGGSVTGVKIIKDETLEDNTISVAGILAPGTLVSLTETLVPLSPIPNPGIEFNVSGKGPNFSAFNQTVVANGTDTAGQLLSQLNSGLEREGINFNTPILDPNGNLVGYSTPFFRADSADIFWNGNTGLDLANFGVTVETVPEPSSVILLLTALAVALFLCSKVPQGGRQFVRFKGKAETKL